MAYLGTQPNDVKKNTGLYTPSEILQLTKDGSWGGSLELIESQTFSGVSAVDFTSIKENKYDVHYMQLSNVQHTGGLDTTMIQLYESGVLETASVYQSAAQYNEAGGSNGELKTTGSSSIYWSYNNNGTTQDARDSENGYIYFYNLGDSTKYSFFTFQELFTDFGAMKMSFGGGVLPQASTVDGIRLKMNNGENTSGTIKLYGVKQI